MSKSKRIGFKVFCVTLSILMLVSLTPTSVITSFAEEEVPCQLVLSSTTDANRYLTTVNSNAFNAVMYNSTYSGVFGDQHMSGIELILHGYRIATNGDLHYLPTPEQWDATPAPTRGTKTFNNTTNTITVPMSISPGGSEPQLLYTLVGEPHPDGGLRLSVVLRSNVSADLTGKARFNLEFIPSKYREKSYMVDTTGNGKYDDFGIFPFHPQDGMVNTKRPNMPGQVWYVQEWNQQRGDSQPMPFATGYGFQFAPEDDENNISIKSETGEMELFDGRNRAQNGWYVLSEQVRGGKTGDTIISWHILPKVKQGWVRPVNVAFSQAGYGTDQEKFAVMEIDKWDTSFPTTASLLHVNADGSKDVVYTANLTTPASSADWQRYKYRRFTFTDVKQEGMYMIRYGDQESEIFPIADNVYDRSWQIALNGYMVSAMDHIEARETDRLWHGASHMEDATIGQRRTIPGITTSNSWFDGWSVSTSVPTNMSARGLNLGSRIPNYNIGGWYDAGDFDIQIGTNSGVINNVVRDALIFDNMDGLDELSVIYDDFKTGGVVEMHKPDGVPDLVSQVVHGIKFLIANLEELGTFGGTVEVRSLRQYTHLGDGSTDTDGWIYDPTLGPNEIVERNGVVYSGTEDDRMLLSLGSNATVFGTHSANIAACAYLAHDYYPEFAQKCLNIALNAWDSSRGNQAPNFGTEWSNICNLMLACYKFGLTERYEFFKSRAAGLATTANITSSNIITNYQAAVIRPHMDAAYKAVVDSAGNAVTATTTYVNYPFGVQFTTGSGWGGSPTIINFGVTPAIVCRLFPNNANIAAHKTNVLRAANYILGTHPVTNNSWLSGFGTKTHTHPYNSNRADEGFIPGSLLPGHITVSPDIVESLDDFSFLWFENESIVSYQPNWICVGIAASKIAKETTNKQFATTKDFANSFMMDIKKTSASDGYLASQGFDAFLFNNTYAGDFGDLKAAGLELVQAGQRIATNGDVSLLPTQKQWYANSASVLKSRTIDEAGKSISAALTIPGDSAGNAAVNYSIKTEPEPGGVKLTVKLDGPLPEDLAGKAGFNLEFSPGKYTQKSYQVDSDADGVYDKFSIFQLSPDGAMEKKDLARTADQPQYIKDYNAVKGDNQPLPLAAGKKITLASEDDNSRIRITSDSGNLSIYDGRMISTNGWFVVRTEFAAGQTEIVWHISSGLKPGWTREPNVAFNQAGYTPDLTKVAVIELDPQYNAPATAYLDKVNPDGSFTQVFSGQLGAPTVWKRYNYRNFDFSPVKEPGLYAIRYAGVRTELFPIAKTAYDRIWKSTLSGFLPIQMDHMTVREGYKIWSLDAHRDDALLAPLNVQLYEGWKMDSETDSGFSPLQHINGLNVGGWTNSGNFNLKTEDNLSVIQDLALAFDEFGVDYDSTYIDWDAKFVELHRNDHVPDLVQQVKQGILQILGQVENVGYTFQGLAVPTLWQHTTSGDGSRLTDRRNYDSSLAADERYGLRSGIQDDRLAFAGKKDKIMQLKAAAALASASYVLEGYEDALANRCLAAAEKIWNTEIVYTSASDLPAGVVAAGWSAAVQMLIAKDGDAQVCKKFMQDVASIQFAAAAFGADGWKAVRILGFMDSAFSSAFVTALKAYLPVLDAQTANPFGVPLKSDLFTSNADVIDMGIKMSVLHKYFPDIVGSDYAFRVADYILGKHMYNNTSWVSNIGTKSMLRAYGGNRADNYYIAGGVVNGFANIGPDFTEAQDDLPLMQAENEYTIDTAAKWVALASGVVRYAADEVTYSVGFDKAISVNIVNDTTAKISGYAVAAIYGKDGRLVANDVIDLNIPAIDSFKAEFDINLSQYPLNEFSYKVFFWDKNFAPLTGAVSKSK